MTPPSSNNGQPLEQARHAFFSPWPGLVYPNQALEAERINFPRLCQSIHRSTGQSSFMILTSEKGTWGF